MPDTCCAFGCSNRKLKQRLKFYHIPLQKKKPELWKMDNSNSQAKMNRETNQECLPIFLR